MPTSSKYLIYYAIFILWVGLIASGVLQNWWIALLTLFGVLMYLTTAIGFIIANEKIKLLDKKEQRRLDSEQDGR